MAMKFLKTPYPASMNDGKHVFVFGSNLAGRHGAGAALEAIRHWGAVRGQGAGLQGQSYAIATKDRRFRVVPIHDIKWHVNNLIYDMCQAHQSYLTYLVTPIGTGLAGYSHEQIAPMFKDAPSNCILPLEWKSIIEPELFSDCKNQNPD